jgi:hypothetical protein
VDNVGACVVLVAKGAALVDKHNEFAVESTSFIFRIMRPFFLRTFASGVKGGSGTELPAGTACRYNNQNTYKPILNTLTLFLGLDFVFRRFRLDDAGRLSPSVCSELESDSYSESVSSSEAGSGA